MILDVRNIEFEYIPNKKVFNGISFKLFPGEIIGIVGPSGAGKSTLLKCLAGQLSVNKGKIVIEGEQLVDPQFLLKAEHPEIGLVNQLFELDDYFTVRENISNQLHHLSSEIREKFTDELLAVFELQDIQDKKSNTISGGEKQRLSMACALAKEPRCLLLDEPFVHFDVHLNKKIREYLRELIQLREMGVVIVTHNGEESLSWCDRILMLRNGKITSTYTPKSAYFKPKSLYEGRFFGELNSVYQGEKQLLFRPNEYSLTPKKDTLKLELNWKYSIFKGYFYSNYFKLNNGREVVLYSNEKLNSIQEVYVEKLD